MTDVAKPHASEATTRYVWEGSSVEGHLRASDDDRDRAVASLADHLLAGRLSLEEFTDRIESAYGAKVGDELEALQVDLPTLPAPPVWRRKPMRLTAAFFGHVVRRGQLGLRRWTVVGSVLAGIDLDLRQAEIELSLIHI